MQKLLKKLKNTPGNASLVPCSVSSGLNREEIPSDQNKVLFNNNSEENHRKHKSGSDLRVLSTVYVLNQRSNPLMPTCQSRARRLLKTGRAKVVKRYPFTIQLLASSGENKQEIVLGADAGYQHVGISAVSEKQELFSAEVELRTNIVKLLSERRMYRRGRRNKLWYRKPRFLNRGNEKSGWLSPSIQHKIYSHLRIVEKVYKFLPVTKVIIETAKFDIQKINNPDIEGVKYQNGAQRDFCNVREYVLYRDEHRCRHCKKDNLVLNVHHIESRQDGGDRPDNLITLCKKCHKDYHDGKVKLDIEIKNNFRSETCMSIIRNSIVEELKKKDMR